LFFGGIKSDGFVKSPIFPFFWIPAYAGMTIKQLISSRYNIRHTREGGYPGVKMTFYEFIKSVLQIAKNHFHVAKKPLLCTIYPFHIFDT
jgi:hypothetical protein